MDHNDLRHDVRRRMDAAAADPELTYTFTEAERDRLIESLGLAAKTYTDNAKTVRAEIAAARAEAGLERIAEQFDRQVVQVYCLAARLDRDDDRPTPEGHTSRRDPSEYTCGQADCIDCYRRTAAAPATPADMQRRQATAADSARYRAETADRRREQRDDPYWR